MSGESKSAPTRLYVKGVVMSYTRSKVNQSSTTNILKLQGVNDAAASRFYAGKVRSRRTAAGDEHASSTTPAPSRSVWPTSTRPSR